jgi:hypothetical protein
VIKVPITYKDFDENEVTEDHYFHLSKAELIKMATEDGGDFGAKLEAIGKSGDPAKIMATFSDMIAAAYGQRVDGSSTKFYKNDDLTKEFMGSLAFDELLTMLLTDGEFAARFTNGLLPKDIADGKFAGAATTDVPLPGIDGSLPVDEKADPAKSGLGNPYDNQGQLVPWAFREPTEAEVRSMHPHQLQDVFRRKSSDWTPPVPA